MNEDEISFTKRKFPCFNKTSKTRFKLSDLSSTKNFETKLCSYYKIFFQEKKYTIVRDSLWKDHKDDFKILKQEIKRRINSGTN